MSLSTATRACATGDPEQHDPQAQVLAGVEERQRPLTASEWSATLLGLGLFLLVYLDAAVS